MVRNWRVEEDKAEDMVKGQILQALWTLLRSWYWEVSLEGQIFCVEGIFRGARVEKMGP